MTTTTRSRSASPSTPSSDEPPRSKRPRLASPSSSSASSLPYDVGMHLAPMVRIGTLPTRLLSLEYGASLVWGPEIVDKALIGSTRSVDPKTGVVSFMKNNRSIFECHPIEKERLIFQLGSADPELAVKALKVIENDVAGVGLNCGCPKSFSLSGGMGAALLKDPERLCNILKALVSSTSLPIDAKIRLLPLPETPSSPPSPYSEDPTLPLIRQTLSTGIKCLTVHCRTQTMRSSEPALHSRLLSINKSLSLLREKASPEEEWTKIPVVCNGDVTGGNGSTEEQEKDTWGNFREVCRETGVRSVMIARAAESNPSCFNSKGLEDPIKVVIPRLLRIAILTKNHYSNTKYVLNALNLHHSPTPPGKELNRDLKLRMNKAKTYLEMGEIFGIGKEEVERLEKEGDRAMLEEMVPRWMERLKGIQGKEEEKEEVEKK
ncbi:tRNA-dihydrouridine(20) synthase (NAD(+)) [Sporobolomyces salmoneus]|uniref:tRNA-dihydrouridine(20) synthase (NAD(+)) n=1 Tax=Sporobolomyces salmoneus TaxID=183962 RepID=UPI00317E11EA